MPRTNPHVRAAAAGLSLALVLALPALGEPASDGVPSAHEKARYETLRAHSPFSVATVVAVAPPPQASFAANWFVSGIGRIGDADFVTIKSRDLATAFSLYARETDPVTGVALASVNWSDMVGKSTVILRKGTETARLEFNEAELRAAPVTPTAAPAPGQPPPKNANASGPAAPINAAAPVNSGPVPAGTPPIRRRMVPIQPPR